MIEKIKWGIIGCGDVTEVKSGPAFSNVNNSVLHAVMRRDAAKAKDYAMRHSVPVYYSKAIDLINDEQVNAVYIATPPYAHEEYAMAAIAAGKPVYIEKPLALNGAGAGRIMQAATEKNLKLVVAHYRRAQPIFIKIKQLLEENAIGKIMYASLNYRRKPLSTSEMTEPKTSWRLNPSQSGGGLFHDLAPHQLGLMYYFFGEAKTAAGISGNQSGMYAADDMVTGNILFKNGVQFSGSWCFSAAANQEADYCEIFGSLGSIGFSVFNQQQIKLDVDGKQMIFSFEPMQHVQQPLIEKVVQYFLGNDDVNPCPPQEGCAVMQWMDAFTGGKVY